MTTPSALLTLRPMTTTHPTPIGTRVSGSVAGQSFTGEVTSISLPKTLDRRPRRGPMIDTTTHPTRPRRVTKRQAEAVLSAVRHQFAIWIEEGHGPTLQMDFDWLGVGAHPAIVWEGGPSDWPQFYPGGGVEEEFGFTIAAAPAALIPAAVFTEAETSWALGIYPA